MRRLKLASIHFGCSLVLLFLLCSFFYFGWYFWPNWQLMDVQRTLSVLLLVDVGLGPFVTLLIASPRKERLDLQRDVLVVVFIQLSALLYGVGIFWNARPLFYVFSEDRIELISASSFDEVDVEAAKKQHVNFIPGITKLPTWVWAPLPKDKKIADAIVTMAITQGKDITSMPQYFRPFKEGRSDIERALKPLNLLRGAPGMPKSKFDEEVAKIGRPSDEVGFMLIEGRGKFGSLLFDRRTLEPIAYWSVFVLPSRN